MVWRISPPKKQKVLPKRKKSIYHQKKSFAKKEEERKPKYWRINLAKKKVLAKKISFAKQIKVCQKKTLAPRPKKGFTNKRRKET